MTALLDLPDTLRAWGLDVVEVTGWQDRRRPGVFNPLGVLIHHTAGPKGKDAPSLQVCIDGRRDLPGPLCQLLVARSGKVYVISSNRCNHAGTGGPLAGIVAEDQGNAQLVGIEAENDGLGETWHQVQLTAMVRTSAAVLDLLGRPRSHCWGHKEYTARKPDPAGIDMTQFRARVAVANPPLEATVPTEPPENDPGARIQRAINANGLQPPLTVDGQCGPATADGLNIVLAYLNGAIADLRKANATSAETFTRLAGERDSARANREAAEAEVAMLRKQLQEGGRLPALLAEADEALRKLDVAGVLLGDALAKARA